MSEEPYLIAHIVRGEPAFDIAIQMPMGEEVWWIIPTSGHRARPYWHIKLIELCSYPDKGSLTVPEMIGTDEAPANWPDHYPIHRSPVQPKITSAEDLLKELGL